MRKSVALALLVLLALGSAWVASGVRTSATPGRAEADAAPAPQRAPRLVTLGDSITEGGYQSSPGVFTVTRAPWGAQVAAYRGWSFVNAGVSGSTVAIVPGNHPMVERYAADVLAHRPGRAILAGGTNDWANNVPLGSLRVLNDDRQFISAYYHTARGILESLPNALVYCSTPVMRGKQEVGDSTGAAGLNAAGLSLEMYRQAIRDVVALLESQGYAGRVSTLETGAGTFEAFRYRGASTYWDPSGYHPNQAGHDLIADFVKVRVR